MELNYSELRKRDVINVSDGRCLGRITDIRISFPKGVLVGITVPGRRKGLFCFFDKTEIYIDRSRIIKIGGDVILVDLKCSENYSQFHPNEDKPRPPSLPPCPPVCPPPNRPRKDKGTIDLSDILDDNGRIDTSDY